jgi:hypothetical protein
MTPKEIATHYQAKTFESPEAAIEAGFTLGEKLTTRNVWNKASAAQAIIAKLLTKRSKGEAAEIGLVIDQYAVTGCYLPPGNASVSPAGA